MFSLFCPSLVLCSSVTNAYPLRGFSLHHLTFCIVLKSNRGLWETHRRRFALKTIQIKYLSEEMFYFLRGFSEMFSAQSFCVRYCIFHLAPQFSDFYFLSFFLSFSFFLLSDCLLLRYVCGFWRICLPGYKSADKNCTLNLKGDFSCW